MMARTAAVSNPMAVYLDVGGTGSSRFYTVAATTSHAETEYRTCKCRFIGKDDEPRGRGGEGEGSNVEGDCNGQGSDELGNELVL